MPEKGQPKVVKRERSWPRRELVILMGIAAPILLVAMIAVALVGGSETGGRPVTGSPSVPSSAPQATGEVSSSPGPVNLVYPDSPTRGPADADVTLVEFLDPECESCRAAYPLVERLLDEYGGRLRLVVRYVPGHGNSALAIAALEEAGRQGRYWEMLDLLFARQPEWGEQATPQTAAFLAYGAELGLDAGRLKVALEDPDLRKVQRDYADAVALGVAGTPTFFVNGVRLENLSEAGLRSMIAEAMSK